MNSTNNKNNKTIIIYSMKIATELINRGHIVLTTIPNSKDPRYTSWIFVIDDTFIDDFKEIKGGLANEQ
jgi:hypothetical protein